MICLEDEAFYALLDKVMAYVKAEFNIKEDKYISSIEAMKMLRIKSKNTMQKYRDEGLIRYYELSARNFLYDVDSIREFLEKKSRDTF